MLPFAGGVVAVIVKMDDVGLHLAEKPSKGAQRVGHALVAAMPRLLAAISLIGTLAMLWVGGHILLVGADNVGWHWPYALVHHAEEWAHHAGGPAGGVLAWFVNIGISAVVGSVVGAVALGLAQLLPLIRRSRTSAGAPDD